MKGAGSSWKFLKIFSTPTQTRYHLNLLLLVSLFSIFSNAATEAALFDNLCSNDKLEILDANSLDDSKLLDELVDVSSSKATEVTPGMKDLLEPYDATPFWYNLVQAVVMASGINPNTQIAMHDLATTSFYSTALNDSIRKVLSFIKCNENTTQEVLESNNGGGMVLDEPEHLPSKVPGPEPVDWTPQGNLDSLVWDGETELLGE